MKPLTGVATIALALAVAGCGGSGGKPYPVNAETNFLNSCESSGGSLERCQCTLHWFEQHRSFTVFQADEDQVNNGSVPEDLKQASSACP